MRSKTFEAIAQRLPNGDVVAWIDGIGIHADNEELCAFPLVAGRKYRVTVEEEIIAKKGGDSGPECETCGATTTTVNTWNARI